MKIDKSAILIKKLALEFDKIANPVLAEHGITASQYRVLKFLYFQETESARVVDIENECSITHPTALGLLENLEKKGFVSKAVNPDDARSKIIKLTEKAMSQKDELFRLGKDLENRFTKGLNESEQKQLNELLNKLFSSVKGVSEENK